ncbi:MAG: UDP-N-acetylmuramoyl-tripeptide--D-alanyl-D-alanine ligase [Thermomicrobiales bacterium]
MSNEFAPDRPISLTEVLAASSARVVGDLSADTLFRWIERDSRKIEAGDLFIAVRGERFDGHQFVSVAASGGAAAALVSNDWFSVQPDSPDLPLLVVESPVIALQRIAAARRASMNLTVMGVTGSLGKTSTKECIAAGLGERLNVYKSPGNMNSEIGLPLSLLEMPEIADVAILEMGGAYALGEVALLAGIAQPEIGVVTNVHPIHLERMGSIEAIAETKTELVESLPSSGTAILNVANPWVAAMAKRTPARVLTYGVAVPADVMATAVRTKGLEGISFDLAGEAGSRQVDLPMVGQHAAELALAAICAGLAMGVDVDTVLSGLQRPGVQVRLLPVAGPRGSQIIDDTYNASAPSVLSALRLLDEIPSTRKIAVLGDMRELGAETDAHNEEVAVSAAKIADVLYTFGDMARAIAESVSQKQVDGRKVDVTSFRIDQREQLTRTLLDELRSGDVALLKGSRGLEMETIVASLRDAAKDSLGNP